MKKYLIAIAMVLTLSSNATATAQKHRHTPRTEQVSDTVKHNPDAIEAFSDTTAAKSNANADFDDDDDSYTRYQVRTPVEDAGEVMEKVFGGLGIAMIIPILAIVIFGLLLPLIILFTPRQVSPGRDGYQERTTYPRRTAEGGEGRLGQQ